MQLDYQVVITQSQHVFVRLPVLEQRIKAAYFIKRVLHCVFFFESMNIGFVVYTVSLRIS